MKVIAFASQKGGSGKTTLAGHVAVQAELAGDGPVALIDTDPQGSLSDWWNERAAETPVFAKTTPERLRDDINSMRAMGVQLVVIDTPPAITQTIENVIIEADIVVIPTRPSPHDLRAAGATVEICERVDKSIVFTINGATPRARITTEAVIALSQHGAVAPSVIHQRVDFASSMIDGRTVMELPGRSRSPSEIEAMWSFLKDALGKQQSAHRLQTHSLQSTLASSAAETGLMVKGAA